MNASNDEGQNPNSNRPAENEQQRKKGKGRQKITMAKIENETNLQVTFSKRRAGVFKKASELSTLCGAESAVVVFSPGNKPHSFGHPNVETVANRLLHPAAAAAAATARANHTDQIIMAHSDNFMQQRNEELSNVEAELEREKARKKDLDSFINGGHLTAPPQLEGLSYEQLEKLKKSVLKFKREFEAKVESSGVANPSLYNGGGGAAASAAAGGSVAAAVDPSYGYIPSYDGGNINGGGSYIPSPSYALPEDVNYGGYMVQYPEMSLGGYNNYGDPAAVVPYYAGTGSSDAGADGGREAAARAGERSKYLGFGNNNYRGHQF